MTRKPRAVKAWAIYYKGKFLFAEATKSAIAVQSNFYDRDIVRVEIRPIRKVRK